MGYTTLNDIEYLAQEFKQPQAQSRAGEWSIKAEELHKLQQIMKSMDMLQDRLVEELKELSHGESSTDGSFLYAKIMRKGSIDYSMIEELHGVDLEVYRKKSVESWKLSKV